MPSVINGKYVRAGTAAVSANASHHFQPRPSLAGAIGWFSPVNRGRVSRPSNVPSSSSTKPTKPMAVPMSFHSQICSDGGRGLASPVRVFCNQSTAPPTPARLKCSHGWVTGGFSRTRAVPSAMDP